MQAVLITCTRELASQDHGYSEILFTQKWNKRELASESVLCCIIILKLLEKRL